MPSTAEFTAKELQIQKCIAASDMYRLLAMFLHLPTEEMVAGILDGTLAEDISQIIQELQFQDKTIEIIRIKLGDLQTGISEERELFTEMRREYTRLFTHPKRPAVAIYETLFLFKPEAGMMQKPSLFISPAALDAERCYSQAGLQRSKEANEPGDHMATEMEYMAYLYYRKAKALHDHHQAEVEMRNRQIKEFSELHLQKWGVDFFNRCLSASESQVYQTFSQVGSIFLSNMLDSSIR
jgi:TorA maturation chaperone TorD